VDPYHKFLDPQTLAKLKDFELKARRVVEGRVSGAHRSPYQGASVEFAEHREYAPGDDVRHIDWRVFAKTERVYLKRYELETNLICNLMVDASQSMSYASHGMSKHLYACKLAANLAYLVLRQRDAVGLTLFEDRIRYFTPPSAQTTTLKQLLRLLDICQPSNVSSRIGETLDEAASRLKGRSLVLIFSDCFGDLEALDRGLKHLRHMRHEAAVFQILDPREIDFDFNQLTMFKGLENLADELVDPRSIRSDYLKFFEEHQSSLRAICRGSGVEYRLLRTDESIWKAISLFLGDRVAA
jgi:uncharacterized protein (DUF58 family)